LRAAALLSWLFGLALLAGLILYWGAGDVAAALALAGAGTLAVMPVNLGTLLADTLGWRALLAHRPQSSLGALTAMRWVGASINELLPVAQVGGEIVRARLLARAGTGGARAGASVVVDLTIGLITELAVAGLGLVLLVTHEGGRAELADLALGLLVFGLLLAGFVIAQRRGTVLRLAHLLEKAAGGRRWTEIAGGAAALDREILSCYRRSRRLAEAASFRTVGWLLGAVELWVIFLVLDRPITLVEAVILESAIQIVRNVGFAIPGALGLQEGGLMAAGLWFGIAPEIGLAAALIRRARALLYGCAGLLVWPLVGAGRPASAAAAGP
jgi:putative membrane protein